MKETLVILALCTWAMRLIGPVFAGRYTLDDRQKKLLSDAAIVLLSALAVTATLFDGSHFGGWARLAGVLLAVMLVLARQSLPIVIIGAAVVTAGLRYIGVA